MNCPNCGNERNLNFCPYCGQNDRDYIRSMPPLLSDIVHETFELDSRIARTLKLLIFQPGELSKQFSRNRRASYSSPIRLYLVASLMFFFVLSVSTTPQPTSEKVEEMRNQTDQLPQDIDLTALIAVLSPTQRGKVDEIMSRTEYPATKSILYGMSLWVNTQDEFTNVEKFYVNQGVDWLHRPGLAMERLTGNLPISMFFMLPVFALLLAILYRKKRRYYVEHLVFSIHGHVITFAVFTVLALIPEDMVAGIPDMVLVTALVVHHYFALLRYYGDGPVLTVMKWGILLLTYFIMLIPGFLLVVFITLSGL